MFNNHVCSRFDTHNLHPSRLFFIKRTHQKISVDLVIKVHKTRDIRGYNWILIVMDSEDPMSSDAPDSCCRITIVASKSTMKAETLSDNSLVPFAFGAF